MAVKKPDIRFLNDMKNVLYDKKWAEKAPNFELYYMYRGIKKLGIRDQGLRYDVTSMPSRMLGEEFVKTKGNRNSKSFPELYTVLAGEAIFLMQKVKKGAVEDVTIIKAKKGNWLIVPAKYAVVMINPSKKNLKTGNWVSEKNKNIYKELEARQGACYYYTKSGWIKNKKYVKVPKLRFKRPLKKIPKNLDFLHDN